jgi:UDP:flavonoid glycosyltransferase YjiC (YdhE family)
VLFAWELGSNLGHLSRDLPLARLCRDRGYDVVMAVPDLRGATSFLAREGFTVIPSPRLRQSARRVAPPINYADMLLREGYDDPQELAGAVNGWQGLLELARPECMVYNHAPTALIAARAANLPVLMVGTGFEIPPRSQTLPCFRPWQPIGDDQLREVESLLLQRINAVLSGADGVPLGRLTDLFAPDTAQLTTFPELDAFGPRSGPRYIGPVFALSEYPSARWSAVGRKRVFAYLRASIPGVTHLLQALGLADAEVLCAVPDLPKEWPSRFDRLRFAAHPVELAGLLPGADLVITYGAGTIATALLAARPVLLVPQVVEQYLAGLALERTGAGLMLREDRAPGTCAALLESLLGNECHSRAAADFARRHARFTVAAAAESQFAALQVLQGSIAEPTKSHH